MPSGNMIKCCSMQCELIFECEGCNPSENSLWVAGGVWSTCNVTETDVDLVQCFWQQQDRCWRKQQTRYTSTFTVDNKVCHADALIRPDRCMKLTNIAQELLLGSADSYDHNQLDYRKECVCLVLENIKYDHKVHHTGLSLHRYTHHFLQQRNSKHCHQ